MSVSWFLSCFFISWNDALFSLLHFVTQVQVGLDIFILINKMNI